MSASQISEQLKYDKCTTGDVLYVSAYVEGKMPILINDAFRCTNCFMQSSHLVKLKAHRFIQFSPHYLFFTCSTEHALYSSFQTSVVSCGSDVVKSLTLELRGEGVSVLPERRQEERDMVLYAHPDDLATSIRPYDGFKVV